MHLVKLQHSNLPHNLGLFSTSKWVGFKPTVDFRSGSRPCRSRLPSPIFQPNRKFHLVRGCNTPRPTPQAPFFKPSLDDNYATHEFVKLGVEPSPTLRLITQVLKGAAP
jgi:hypothetical protein